MKIWDKRYSTKEQIKGYSKCLGTIAAILVIVSIIVYSATCAADSIKQQNRETYEDWTRINPQYNLTYDQWFALYVKNLLPANNNVNLNPKTEDK